MGMIKFTQASIEFFRDNQGEIFETGNLAEGKWNQSVADWACTYTGSKYSLAVNSNGAGLFLLLRILKEYRGKKRIFIQSNTMYGVRTIAITSGLQLCGYVDCNLDYLMPDYDQVVDFVSLLDKPEECVFLLTHIGGWVNPDIQKIAKFCKERGISLIEDCAHSLGSLLGDKHTGLFGNAGVYSLFATKAIPVGEGGIIVTNDQELAELANKFVMYDRFDQKMDVGINLRMSEISALLTYSVVKETEDIIENKYKIAEKYESACKKFERDYIDPKVNQQRSNLYKFILLSRRENPEIEFDQIKTRTSPVYDYTLGKDMNDIITNHACLPIWYNQDRSIVEKVINQLEK